MFRFESESASILNLTFPYRTVNRELGFATKVKRGYSDRILTPGVIPTPECSSSFIKATKLKPVMQIAVPLTYTESKNHRLTPQYAGDISAIVGITPPSE